MHIEAGESHGGDSGTDSSADDLTARARRSQAVGRPGRGGVGDESVASYARIAPRPRRQRPTRSDLLGGGDASKAPKRLTAGEHPIEGDSSGHAWDDPDEL